MSTRRSAGLLATITAAFAFAVIAAFGSGSASLGAEARAKGATAVPATALAYVSINADRSGAPWQALEALAAKLPGGAKALADLNAQLEPSAGMTKALGGDISVALLGIGIGSGLKPAASAVMVATAADGLGLVQVLEQAGFVPGPALNGAPVWEKDAFAVTVTGSIAIGATSRATLRSALAVQSGAAASLADDPAFQATFAKLPSDPLVAAYLSPLRLAGLAEIAAALAPQTEDMPGAAQAITQFAGTLKHLRGLGLAVQAEQNGLRIVVAGDADEAALAVLGARMPAAYTPSITNQIPADAAGFVAFRDLGPTLLAAIDVLIAEQPQLAATVAALEQSTGVSLRDGLVPALTGEHALVGLAGDTPTGALLLVPPDPAAAGATLTKAIATMLGFVDVLPGADTAKQNVQLAVTQQPGGSIIAIGNAPQLATAPTASISSSDAYRAITSAAGVPSAVTGIAYINGAALQKMAVANGKTLPPAAAAIKGIVAWGTPGAATLFVSIG